MVTVRQQFVHAKLDVAPRRRSAPLVMHHPSPLTVIQDKELSPLSSAHSIPQSWPLQVGLQLAIPSQPAAAGVAGPSRFGPAFKAGPAGSVPGAPSGAPSAARAAPTREDLMTQHARRLTDLLDSFKVQVTPFSASGCVSHCLAWVFIWADSRSAHQGSCLVLECRGFSSWEKLCCWRPSPVYVLHNHGQSHLECCNWTRRPSCLKHCPIAGRDVLPRAGC